MRFSGESRSLSRDRFRPQSFTHVNFGLVFHTFCPLVLLARLRMLWDTSRLSFIPAVQSRNLH